MTGRVVLLLLGGLLVAGAWGARAAVAPPPLEHIAPHGPSTEPGLTPAVQRSSDAAVAAAAAEGVELRVTSGWRSADHQQQLYDEALATYGTPEQARQWVLPPQESAHVHGEAVDVGPPAGAAWLQRHGEQFGLCQRYENEPWHFERLAGALGSVCPAREPHA